MKAGQEPDPLAPCQAGSARRLKSNRPVAASLLSGCERYRVPMRIMTRWALHPFSGHSFPDFAFHRWSVSSHGFILAQMYWLCGKRFKNRGILSLWGRALVLER
jgi:hypothetical protein